MDGGWEWTSNSLSGCSAIQRIRTAFSSPKVIKNMPDFACLQALSACNLGCGAVLPVLLFDD